MPLQGGVSARIPDVTRVAGYGADYGPDYGPDYGRVSMISVIVRRRPV